MAGLLFFLLLFLAGSAGATPVPVLREIKGTVEFRGAYSLPLPHEMEGQSIRTLTVSPTPDQIRSDAEGNRIASWHRPPETVRIQFVASLRRIERKLDSQRIAPYERPGALFRRYTRSEGRIQLSPAIRQLSRAIVGTERNPLRKVRRIQAWSQSHGGGAIRFAALCRASEVPARLVSGFLLGGPSHLWAEFYLPRFGWLPVDGASMGLIDGTHLVLAKGASVSPGGRLSLIGSFALERFVSSPFHLEVPIPHGWTLTALPPEGNGFRTRMSDGNSVLSVIGKRFSNPEGLGIREIALEAIRQEGLSAVEEDYLYRPEMTGYRMRCRGVAGEEWRVYFLKEERLIGFASRPADPNARLLMGVIDSLSIK